MNTPSCLHCKGPVPPPPSVDEGKPKDKDQAPTKGGGIRCPHCAWTPTRHDLWTCHCGCSWHTFDTGGRCPSCNWNWSQTQCPRCKGWAAHAAWYDTGNNTN
ncbi:hypothetical protein F183_A38120 [Bryobacterales bacterium F-183]|nr:hypothetical protein F183_A38120 [Bryobacterales bacterium F-183]